jgi:hypothetical protein
MNAAKLRRSRDVSASHPVKFENTFEIRNLSALNVAIYARSNSQESAGQASDSVCKSTLVREQPARLTGDIFSGRYPTACLRKGGFAL